MRDITHSRLRELIAYDAASGAFSWAAGNEARGGKRRAGTAAGYTRPDGYVQMTLDWNKYEAGRVAWPYMTGAWPAGDIDHRDGNPGNNRWLNLRDIPHRQNIENRRRPNRQNKAGLLGVSPSQGGLYRAQITVLGKCLLLGEFTNAELAHAAYIDAKRQLHEGNTL